VASVAIIRPDCLRVVPETAHARDNAHQLASFDLCLLGILKGWRSRRESRYIKGDEKIDELTPWLGETGVDGMYS
jgi:hypothetical protein